MQIEFFPTVHINNAYFYSQDKADNEFVLALFVLQKVSATNFTEKNNKNKWSKTKKYIRNL